MTRRYHNGIYHYLGSLGNICTDRDTGSAKHTLRFELEMYLNREEVRQAQWDLFKSRYPNHPDIDLKMIIAAAEDLAR